MIRLPLLCFTLLITFFSTASAESYRLGVPKGHIAPTIKQLIQQLKTNSLTDSETLKVVPIDLSDYSNVKAQERIRQEISQKCDLFFTTGNHLSAVFSASIDTPLLFIATRSPKHNIPPAMKKNSTGFYWGPTATMFKRSASLLPPAQRNKMGLIYFQGSKFDLLKTSYIKTCAKLGIELIAKEYQRQSDIESTMRQFKKEGVNAIILFPPAIRKGELKELLKWQDKLTLPIIAQTRPHVEQGALGGPVIDYRPLLPKLSDYAIKILRGRSPDQLPIKYLSRKYLVNLATVNKLGISIPKTIIDQAEITGFAKKTAKKSRLKKSKPLKDGNFTIGISNRYSIQAKSMIHTELTNRGYIEGVNLNFKSIDMHTMPNTLPVDKSTTAVFEELDMLFITGNIIKDISRIRPSNIPVIFITSRESKEAAKIPADIIENFTGVIRGSLKRTMRNSQKLSGGGSRMAILAHSNSNLNKNLANYRKIAKSIGMTLSLHLVQKTPEIGPAMRQIKKESDFILLFPSSFNNNDISEVVKWQNQLLIPVLGQRREHIAAGLLGGVILDENRIPPKVAEYIDKVLQGRKPSSLPIYYYQGRYMVNLRAASILKIEVPMEVTLKAEVIH